MRWLCPRMRWPRNLKLGTENRVYSWGKRLIRATARVDISRAVVTCRRSGNPDALVNKVRLMPSACALAVIIRAKRASVRPSFSATATAASFADRTIMPSTASRSVIQAPGLTESLVGGLDAACREKGILVCHVNRPRWRASKARYNVIILVKEAG